jgi:photosystem II stability/assembly factor-like uncharacterized protein
MKLGNVAAQCCVMALALITLGLATGCHEKTEWAPLANQKIYVQDKFFDVAVLGPKHAIVIGYGGKILDTKDGGFTWTQIDSGTDLALYSIDFDEDRQVGWIVGQLGLILRTTDGGKTWTHQEPQIWADPKCRDPEDRKLRLEDEPCEYAYLFAVSVVDANTAHAVGDRSIYTRTTDGGKTWQTETLKVKSASDENISPDMALAFEDPVLYDVQFVDADYGYIVGEFGKIYHTEDGGKSWVEQQQTVMDESVLDILDLPTLFDVQFRGRKNGIATGLDGRIAVTTDGGHDWNFTPNNVKEYIDPFYSAEIQPNGDRWVVGASGQVVLSGPGGQFEQGDLGSRVNAWMRRIRFYDDNVGWIVGGFGLIMSTDDGGTTWYRRIG